MANLFNGGSDLNQERDEKLQIAIATGGQSDSESWQRSLRAVDHAENLGLHSVWLPEGHFRIGATASPLPILAAFAARTTYLRLATTSILLPIHHPLRVAAEVATLDTLSGGRVIVGLGRGFQTPVFQGFGISPSSKRDRFDEALDVILTAWSGESFDLDGTFYTSLDGKPVRVALKPLQKPHPPLVVAAFGPKGLKQAADRSLPYLASPLETLPVLIENYAVWKKYLKSPLPRGGLRAPVMRTIFVSENRNLCRRVATALESDMLKPKAKAPAALARAASGSMDERTLVGGVDKVVEYLNAYRSALDMDLLIARAHPPGASEAECEKSLELLVKKVAPQIGTSHKTPR